MKQRTFHCLALTGLLSIASFGCGGSTTPAAPSVAANPQAPAAPAATPTPEPTPTPTPVPTPSPGTYPNGETVVVRFTVRVQWVEDKDHKIRPYEEGGPIHVGETIRFDSTGKDVSGRPTAGSGELPRWSWEPDEVAMLSGTADFNPRAKARSPGKFYVSASLDGVDSPVLELTIDE